MQVRSGKAIDMAEHMTSRERVLAAIHREEVDHVPLSPSFYDLPEQLRRPDRYQFPWGPSEREKIEYLAIDLGLDPTVSVWMGDCYPASSVASEAFLGEGDVIHKVWRTPSGDLHASVHYDESWPHGLDIPLFSDFCVAHFREPWIKGPADVECLRHILMPPSRKSDIDELRVRHRESKALADRLRLATMTSIGMGLTGALQLFGPANLCLACVDEPETVDAYLELEHRLNLAKLAIALDLGVDMVHRNGYYESADYYGPLMLDRFLGPRLRREIQVVHQGGAAIGYTLNSGVMPLLDYLGTLDFDALMHVDVCMPGTDPGRIREALGGTKSFWLGPCNTHCTYQADPDIVRQAVRDVFQVFGRSGLVLSTSSVIVSTDPWRNTLALVDEWMKLR